MTAPAAGRFVGQAVRRREDPRLLTGHGTFVDDVVLPGMLHAAFVRSDLPRARITGVDGRAARAFPGVHAVLTGADLNPGVGSMQPTMFQGDPPPSPCAPLRPLAEDDVRFVGDPVAIVVADSRYLAEDACELVAVDYEPLPPVVDAEGAATSPELVHAELGSNVALRVASPPDPELDSTFETAPHVVTETLVQHRHTNVPMETRGVVAGYTPATGELDVWISTQNPHEVRQTCARALGIPEHLVRVRMGDVGGGFGQKYFTPRDELAVVAAARHLGRTIKWIEDRRENLLAANHARADRVTVRMAFDDEGRILAVHLDHLEDCGAYPVGGTGGTGPFMAMLFPGPYRIPRLGYTSTAVWTNTCGRGAYRGPWMLETVAREEMIDLAARAIGVDPLELRRRNCLRADELPVTTVGGLVLDHVTPSETLEQAADLIGYDEFRAEQARAALEGRLLGVGFGLYVEPTSVASGSLGTETATVRVQPSGTVTVHLGTGSHGQSVETTMAQVVAEYLGVELEAVTVVQGDTASSPFGGGTGGSRTAVVAGGAARDAALVVREKALQIAAHLLEAAPEDLEVQAGSVTVRGTPTRGVALAEIARVAMNSPLELPPGMTPGLEATASYQAPPITWSNACHACTVEVDPAAATVEVQRYVVSEDCGVMINPMVVEGQIAGGVVQGLGGVLYEHFVYDDDGNPLTTTFLDYLVPTSTEVPMIEYGHIETRSPTPGGHKGMGEGGAIGSPPCVFNAVADALAVRGKRITDQPLTPSRILDALTG
ncbi:MAG TPA: xanthine dehydrogenase family protein molybdopterin-binding subunit [Acidimicrobiia bacterium]|nr:xanthine dehydrogenase family protein molybdopterin-binding subunit [Acidimicrobiia bacterium]